jgi:hypothetical protein
LTERKTMPSRFPGVDPYIEGSGLWPDFHHEFITSWRGALRRSLPKHYEARINEEIHLVDLSLGTMRKILPDVAVERREAYRAPVEQAAWQSSPVAVTLPLPLDEEEVRENWIEIYHRPDRSLVAVLELLSPTNKRGETRSKYLSKRKTVLRQGVHLVELDLLFEGGRIAPPFEYPAADFTALVARGERPGICEVRSWNLRDRLPLLEIPLKSPDADVVVDLQEVFDYSFDQGGYAETVDYEQPPSVLLPEADLKWAAERARSRSDNA